MLTVDDMQTAAAIANEHQVETGDWAPWWVEQGVNPEDIRGTALAIAGDLLPLIFAGRATIAEGLVAMWSQGLEIGWLLREMKDRREG